MINLKDNSKKRLLLKFDSSKCPRVYNLEDNDVISWTCVLCNVYEICIKNNNNNEKY